jgi:3-hydroxybutyryl-CoA dehydrogenase
MNIVILTNEELKNELLAQGLNDRAMVHYISTPQEFQNYTDADIYMDLLYSNNPERESLLKKLHPKPVVVNDLLGNYSERSNLVRINGWNTFLKRPIVEACGPEDLKEKINELFTCFHKKVEWTPAVPGFISARIIAMIINEAYFALQEEVSSKEEIDIAMKAGTNYPHGPFEWSNMIGLKKIYELLSILAKTNKRYEPADLLRKESE